MRGWLADHTLTTHGQALTEKSRKPLLIPSIFTLFGVPFFLLVYLFCFSSLSTTLVVELSHAKQCSASELFSI